MLPALSPVVRADEDALTQAIIDLQPQRLAGDTVYGAVRLLKWLVDRKIVPHIPVWDKSARPDGAFNRADFVFDQERNVYTFPGGAELTSTGSIDQGHIVYYRASKNDCSACSLKPKCTTAVVRKVTRNITHTATNNPDNLIVDLNCVHDGADVGLVGVGVAGVELLIHQSCEGIDLA